MHDRRWHTTDCRTGGAYPTCALFADLAYADVLEARFRLPTVRDSNLALIHREIDRLALHIGVPDILGR